MVMIILTNVRGMVMTHRQRSDMARLAMKTFLAVLISLLLSIVPSTNKFPNTPTKEKHISYQIIVKFRTTYRPF